MSDTELQVAGSANRGKSVALETKALDARADGGTRELIFDFRRII